MPQSSSLRTAGALLALTCILFGFGQRSQSHPLWQAEPIWEVEIPENLRARIYEAAIEPENSTVVVTSPEAVWRVDATGEFVPLVSLDTGGQVGESAILASYANHVGILRQQQDAVVGFELLDISGEEIAFVETPLHFHYRLAPKGDSFVGIDAAGKHTPFDAERFVYRFYDRSGKLSAEIVSPNPQPLDSLYTPGGVSFLVNNADGLFSYTIDEGNLQWKVEEPVRSFAPADSVTGLIVVSDTRERNVIRAYMHGEYKWTFPLGGNVRNLAISPDGAYILATDKRTAHLFMSEEGEPLWSFNAPDSELSFNSVAVNNRGVAALGAQHSSLKEGSLFMMDSKGSEIYRYKLSFSLSNAWIPDLTLDSTGSLLLVRTLEVMLLIRLQ